MILVESPESVEKFLHLQTLSLEQLKNQNNITNHENYTKEALIEMLMGKGDAKVKSQGLAPQGIPLRSKDGKGKIIPKTTKTYQKWRKIMFDANDNLKNFSFINKNGKQYTSPVFYIKCPTLTAKYMIENNWFSPYESQKTLIEAIKTNPENFNYNIVRKDAGKGNNFLMLHCELKKD